MIVTTKVAVRIALLVLVFTLLQSGFFSMVEFLHTSFWILPACAVIFGLLGGSMVGATVGFSIGFLSDALDDGPLGTAALIFMGVGYLAGLYRERGEQPDRLITAGLCGAATIVSSIALGLFTTVLGLDASVSPAILLEVVMQGLYGFLLAFPLYALIRRVLRPALIDERSGRRRRTAALGRLRGSRTQ